MRKILYLLNRLTDSDLEWLIACGNKQIIPADTVLIEQGRDIDTLYIVLDGILELSGVDLGDKPIRLRSGEVVGEVSLLDSRPPTATVTVAEESTLLAVPRSELMEKLEEDVEFAARFYRSLAVFLAQRLRNTYQRLGYGSDEPLDEDTEYEDEISPEMLDSVHIAATRFDRVLQRLLLAD